MDEHEIACRANKMREEFATRLDRKTPETLRVMDAGGEPGELLLELAAMLAATGSPVSGAEQKELHMLLEAMGLPTDVVEHLMIAAPASAAE